MFRREFLQTVTALTAVAGTTSAAAAQPMSNSPALAPTPVPPRLAQLDIKSFSNLLESVAPLKLTTSTPPLSLPPDIPQILQPIDTGAVALLTPYKLAPLIYSPMEVEYLVNALDEHITNLINLREKAQQLEVLAVAERLDVLLDQKATDFMQAMADFSQKNDKRTVGTMVDPVISPTSITSASSQAVNQYWTDRRTIQQTNIKARQDVNDARAFYMTQPGSGNNHVQRFNFLKQLFDRELIEAYRRAQSVAVGLKAIYGIDKPLPELVDIGYLSQLALWEKDIYYTMELRVMQTIQTTLAVGLRKNADPNALPGFIADADFVAGRQAGTLKFNLPTSFFYSTTAKLKNPRLKGLEAYLWAEANPKVLDYIRVSVTLPDQSIRDGGNKIWSNLPTVILPLATFPQGPEFNILSRREVRNANPLGDWIIQIDKRTLTDKENAESVLHNLFLVMRISSDMVN